MLNSLLSFFLFYNSFIFSPSCNVFCDSFFIVDPSFYIIGSLPPSSSLFDIIMLIHDRLLMVARLSGMCLLLASLTLLLRIQYT